MYDRYRALYGLRPLLTNFGGELVKLFKLSFDSTQSVPAVPADRPGQLEYSKRSRQLLVRCGDGRALELLQLSVGGKKTLSGQDFYNGFLSKVNRSDRYFK